LVPNIFFNLFRTQDLIFASIAAEALVYGEAEGGEMKIYLEASVCFLIVQCYNICGGAGFSI